MPMSRTGMAFVVGDGARPGTWHSLDELDLKVMAAVPDVN